MNQLSEAKIKRIRDLRMAGLKLREIGKIIGCSHEAARKILLRNPIFKKELKVAKLNLPIKYKCASCGKHFYNSEERYLEAGNYCEDCLSKINYIQKFKQAERMKNIAKQKLLLSILKEKWGIGREHIEIMYRFGDNIKKVIGVLD
jgi:DNA-directed RNA polymerase subunit RPC12/RpoP